ncbi:hypothetical protein R4144_08455 [Gordonia amicalis]|uniref:hypothetical protein n=1 Tax=Gordonia TaxID=2053 RepID=UPI000BB7C2A7|nr:MULTISPECIES: hypothetical protein [Gordonia]ATD70330.1 hypothetical protein CNO18_08645 [Gordonia sp. 1D]MDV7173420.1 hypothetical protein [Gordonia amicalis]UKO93899.1 hypothetical protein IHQ52_11755 [Gordonia amicalis]UOG21516.1 hypothetical protein MTX80_21925 [Gordonia amicalis]
MPPATLIENAYDAESFGCAPPDHMESAGRVGPGAERCVWSAPRRRIASIEPGEFTDLVLWDLTTAVATQLRRLLDKAH